MRWSLVPAVFLLAAQLAWADLTVRQQTVVKFGPALPTAMTDTVKQQMASTLPSEMILRVKGNTCSTAGGAIETISDYDAGRITLLNSKSKTFASTPLADFASEIADAMPRQQMPAGAGQMLQSMKVDVQTKKTGQAGLIGGIRAEEYLVTLSMSMPGLAAGMKMEMRNWLAVPEELSRIPALKELAACSSRSGNTMDLSQALQKMFSQLPGVADKFLAPIEELRKNSGSLSLKTQTAVYVPGLTALLGPSSPGMDPNAPLTEVTTDLAGFSTEPLPDSVFKTPADYQPVPIEDLIRVMMPPAAQVVAPQTARESPQQSPTPGALRPGNGVSPPTVVSRREPAYTAEALRAKIQGSVSLSVVVDINGNPQNIKVVQSLDPGLDQKAIEAVRQWKFQPGQKNGQPVAVMATVQVNFRLLDKQ
jgi:TonB family protein